jgi:NAD(P)-dependent dehydrogenase (short-subunit alcohol dehydrogenase family)
VVDIDENRAKKVAGELSGGGHLGVGCDLMDWERIRQLFEQIGAEYGLLDVLVNNVGMTSAERFDERGIPSIERRSGSTSSHHWSPRGSRSRCCGPRATHG